MINAAIIALCVLAEYMLRELTAGIFTISRNPGAAFGILRDWPEIALILSGLACVIIIAVVYLAELKPLTRIGLEIMAGGALSNMLERIFLGYVVDWIPVPFFDLQYNLADVEISLGALIAFISIALKPES